MAVRLKTRWHHTRRSRRRGAPKTLEDRAGVVAHNIWKIAFAGYQNMVKEDFRFAGPEQVIALLTEFIAFLLQVADRNVYGQLGEEDRRTFITAVASRLAETVNDNLRDLYGEGDYRGPFIKTLNGRARGYSECSYDDNGPGYSFLRYFGDQAAAAMAAGDNKWVIEHVMEIEAPQALKLIRKTLGEVLGIRPR